MATRRHSISSSGRYNDKLLIIIILERTKSTGNEEYCKREQPRETKLFVVRRRPCLFTKSFSNLSSGIILLFEK